MALFHPPIHSAWCWSEAAEGNSFCSATARAVVCCTVLMYPNMPMSPSGYSCTPPLLPITNFPRNFTWISLSKMMIQTTSNKAANNQTKRYRVQENYSHKHWKWMWMSSSWKPKESAVLPPQTEKDYYTLKILRVLAPLMALNPKFKRKTQTLTLLMYQVYQYFT